MNGTKKSEHGGIGILTSAQITLIILKLFNLIDWSWCKVFIPTYINFGILAILLIYLLILEYEDD